MAALPATVDLPSVDKARLPATYEGAKTALAQCNQIDECQDWADKAEALASYAKQAQDEELRRMADRIQARAIRRCGELLSHIRSASGMRTDLRPRDGGDPRLTRTDFANDAGLSERQRKTALRVARIPDPEFEGYVEASEPPTVTALAEHGKLPAPRIDHLKGRSPADFQAATALLGLLHHVNRSSPQIDIDAAVRGLGTREIDDALVSLADAEGWLGRVADVLRG